MAKSWKKNRAHNMAVGDSGSEQGIVKAIKDDEAIVEFSLKEACQSCGARVVCIPDASGKRQLRAANPLQAGIGSRVSITEKSNFLLLISFLQYGLPLILFFGCIILLYLFDITISPIPKELVWFLGGLGGLLLGGIVSRHFVERLAEKGGSFFEVSEIL